MNVYKQGNGLITKLNKQFIKSGDSAPRAMAVNEDEIRQKVEQEVWNFARKMISMSGNEVSEMWGCATNFGEVMYNTTYSEAKAKYDAWKKSKSEVHLYDEIVSSVTNVKATIINISSWGQWNCINVDGAFNIDADQQILWEKTGRSFPEFGKLLKKMEVCEENER